MQHTNRRNPRLFVSYAHTNKQHKQWILDLCCFLRNPCGVDVVLDEWDIVAGDHLADFMQTTINEVDKILILSNADYERKAKRTENNFGTNEQIISSTIYQSTIHKKYIPVILERNDSGLQVLPEFLIGLAYIDLSPVYIGKHSLQRDIECIDELLRSIYNHPKSIKPPLSAPLVFESEPIDKPPNAPIAAQEPKAKDAATTPPPPSTHVPIEHKPLSNGAAQTDFADAYTPTPNGAGATPTLYPQTPQTPKQNESVVDQFSTAVVNLGAMRTVWKTNNTNKQYKDTEPNIDARIEAIYTLERIAKDNTRNHMRTLDILTTYIRQNAPASQAKPFTPPERQETETSWTYREIIHNAIVDHIPPPRADIQTALHVLSCRSAEQIAQEQGYVIDLQGTNLQRADFTTTGQETKAHFANVCFDGAHLEGAHFERAQLQHTMFVGAHLQGASFKGAELESASFKYAQLQGTDFASAHLKNVSFRSAHMEAANLRHAAMPGANFYCAINLQKTNFGFAQLEGTLFWHMDLSKTLHFNESYLQQSFGDGTVILPPSFTRPAHWRTETLEWDDYWQAYTAWLQSEYPDLYKEHLGKSVGDSQSSDGG